MARRGIGKQAANFSDDPSARRPTPKPVRMVKRELVSPAGRKVLVDVPVYAPFRLEDRPEEIPAKASTGDSEKPGKAETAPASDPEKAPAENDPSPQ